MYSPPDVAVVLAQVTSPAPSDVAQHIAERHNGLVYDRIAAGRGELPAGLVPDRFGVEHEFAEARVLDLYWALWMVDRWNWNGESIMSLATLVNSYVRAWATIYRHQAPDVLIAHEVPHRGFDYIALAVAEYMGIPTLVIQTTAYADRLIMTRGIHGPALALGKGMESIQKPVLSEYIRGGIPRNRSLVERRRAPLLRRPRDVREQMRHGLRKLDFPQAIPGGDVGIVSQKLASVRALAVARRSFGEYKNASLSLKEIQSRGAYILYPLHYQPEATTLPVGGWGVDQINNIGLLRDGLPDDVDLVVKEHPAMLRVNRQWPRARNMGYYEHLARMPGVILADVHSSMPALIDGAEGVATVTGTVGWEALSRGAPVLLFGSPWYRGAPGTAIVHGVDCVREFMGDIVRKRRQAETEFKDWEARFLSDVAFVGTWNHKVDGSPPSPNLVRLLKGYAESVRDGCVHVLGSMDLDCDMRDGG